ncbi:MAG: hypothetical protein H6707_15075 [Deltaproteobacteria bacterium]|nr:hypothetical protein [Deltaproteobacteria bacterium]
MKKLLGLVFLILWIACSGSGAEPPPLPAEHCNPLVGGPCLLPWPSSYYLDADPSTTTGYRVRYPAQAVPANREGVSLSVARYQRFDGFSIGSQPLVSFPEGVAADGLPTLADLARADQQLIQIVEATTGQRVPLFAELDANAKGNNEIPALIIRPQVPLKPNTRYIVALRNGLKDRSGAPLSAPQAFAWIRDGGSSATERLDRFARQTREAIALLEQHAKIPAAELVLAWDFHTASNQTMRILKPMVEATLAELATKAPAFEVLEVKEQPNDKLLRFVAGRVEEPLYLESDSVSAWLKFGTDGAPLRNGKRWRPVFISVPRCAEKSSSPVPVILFGHGLFLSAEDELSGEYHSTLGDRLCAVQVATPIVGLANSDLADISGEVITNFTNVPRITDQLVQTQIGLQVVARWAKVGLSTQPFVQGVSGSLVDDQRLYYLGISNGGIQGVAFAALNPDIKRFAFHVGGGWWSLMLQRSSNFNAFAVLMKLVYRDPTDRLLLLHLSQSLWDYTDPIVWADLLAEQIGAKRVLYHESLKDEQVPNLATRAVARVLGLPRALPGTEAVFGLTDASLPQDSAYVQWDIEVPYQVPEGNLPAPVPASEEVSAHRKPRRLEACFAQWERFFRADGVVEDTCDGKVCGRN